MGRSKRCRISVRFIRVLNTDGSTKKRYKLEEKGKHLTLISDPTQMNTSDPSCISAELLLAATTLNKVSEKQHILDESISGLKDIPISDIAHENSAATLSEPESPPHSTDTARFPNILPSTIKPNKKGSNGFIKQTNFEEEFLKLETFEPINSFWPSESTPFSSPSSPEINLDSDFTVDEVPLNLNLDNTDNLLSSSKWNIHDKVDSNDFGLNFPNFCSTTSEEFPNLFSTW